MKKDTEILSSFDLKKGLNPKVWVKDNKSTKLKPEIREKLLEIAYEFIEFLGVDIIVSDAHIIGSMVNYNWSKYSDFDLHIIADFEQFPKEQLDLYQELFKLKKTLFNSKHNIKIYGYDVELYVQDSNETYFSSGAYSLIYNKWLSPPKKTDFKADREVLMSKVNQWTEKIDEVIDSAKGKDLESALKLLGGFKDKLKKYRQSGLEGGGELSYENLVFKYLRRNGYIEKLFNFENEKVDKELSLEQKLIGEQGIRDFFNNLFSGKKNKKTEVKVDDPKKADIVSDDVAEFYKTLESIKEPLTQQQRGRMNFQKDVETVQIALQLLGYELPRYGVDGLFGPETAKAINKFSSDNPTKISENISESTKIIGNGSAEIIGRPGQGTHNASDWQSGNAWDVKGEDGSPVFSLTNGTISKIKKDRGFIKSGVKKIYGDQITVTSDGGPNVFYTHITTNLTVGTKVKVGDTIGTIVTSKGIPSHVHIGLSSGTIDNLGSTTQTNSNKVTTITPEMIKVMIEKLKSKGVKSEDLKKYIDVVNTGGGEGFTDIDLMSEEGYKKYENICQKFISTRNSNLLGITGEMMAKAAKNTFSNYKKYVPPQLALAQMTVEGGFNSNPNSRPIRTKNPYNVGNVDNGNNKFFPDVQTAIQGYYDLIARNYLTGGKTAKDLVNNFVNKNNNRYASSSKYESSLNNLVNQINNTA